MGKAAAVPAIAGGVSALAGGGGGGGKKGGKGQASQTQTQALDPRAEQFRNQVFEQAQQVGNQQFQPFGGQRFAGIDPATLQGLQQQIQGFGQLTPNLGLGAQAIQGSLGSGNFGQDVQQFFNPFQEEVIGGIQSDFDRARATSLQGVGDAATRAGAFGGSRQGVAQGQALGELGRAEQQQIGQLRFGGFNQATQNLFQNRAQQAGIGGQLANLGLTGLQGGTGAQLALGQQRRGLDQANRDFQFQEFMRQQNQPIQNLQALQGVLGGAPFGQVNTQFAQGNPFASGLGGAIQAGGGLAQLLGSLFGGGQQAPQDVALGLGT